MTEQRPTLSISWPDTAFTLKQLVKLNPHLQRLTLWVWLRKGIQSGLITQTDGKASGRKRPHTLVAFVPKAKA